MDITFKASGTPAQVAQDLAKQIKATRDTNDGTWPILAATRDYLATQLQGDSSNVVDAELSIRFTVTPGEKARAGASVDAIGRPIGGAFGAGAKSIPLSDVTKEPKP